MEIRKLKHNYQFVNESAWNRVGFYHKSTLLLNGVEIANTKLQYYNRTWECYQFQTSMRSCINDYVEKKLKDFKERYKAKHNITRLTQNKKNSMLQEFYDIEEIRNLRECYTELEYGV